MNKFILVLCCSVFIALLSGCSVNKANIDDDLRSSFDAYRAEGCFAMLNNATGEVTVYNLNDDTVRVSSGGSFNSFLALISLQSGAISNEKALIQIDSNSMSGSNCSNPMLLKDALHQNCSPFFNEMVRRNGSAVIKRWIDTVGYGNKSFASNVDSGGTFKTPSISPDEQLGLMKRLYFEQLPFRKSVQSQVKNMFLREDKSMYRLSFLTGNTNAASEWLTGWIEENKHVYFFVTYIKSKSQSSTPCAESITRDILKRYGFFLGRK